MIRHNFRDFHHRALYVRVQVPDEREEANEDAGARPVEPSKKAIILRIMATRLS